MPGLSIVREDGDAADAFEAGLSAVRFFEEYRTTVHYEGEALTVASTGYERYPVRRVDTEAGPVVLEGYLYDVDDVPAHLADVAAWVAADDRAALRSWIRDRDGDFLAVVVDADDDTATVVPDALGRLPFYHAQVDGATVASRELKLLRAFAAARDASLGVDDLAIAQSLSFGYRLGTRTLFAGVERLPPAATLSVGRDRDVSRLFRHDFGDRVGTERTPAENAGRLADLFETACENRADLPGSTVLALSGGLDSRAVAGAFDACDVDFSAATFDRPDGSASDEVRAARAVAETLDVDWQQYVARDTDEHRETLLDLKQGMNYLRLSFLVDFLERLDQPRGAATYVTGDGGDKVFPDMRPPKSFVDEAEAVEYAIAANSIFDPAEAAAIAGVSERRLRASVRDRFAEYPEMDLRDAYVHFLVRERGMNWLYQGEDRNRYYYWSASPFYAVPFFRAGMAVPPEQKGPAFYRQFLEQFAPELVDIEYVNFGASITSAEYRLKRFVYDTLSRYPSLQDAVVTAVKRVTNDATVSAPEVVGDLSRELAAGADADSPLSPSAIENVVHNPESYSEPEMYHLLTVTTLVGRQASG
jgi:asparagine synthase (glutamine-hydrolysing)